MLQKLIEDKSKYIFHYYAIRGYGELARLIFAYAGIKYTDHRMHWDEWQEEKKNSEYQFIGIWLLVLFYSIAAKCLIG